MMSKKKERNLAGFSEVARDNIESSKNSDSNNDLMDDILQTRETKDKTHTFRGFYLENDLVRALDRNTVGKPKGVKSDLINAILREKFKAMGWIE